jgi:antirestriction protein ArdC
MSDIYQTITDRIVAQIAQGPGAWRMPWHIKHGATEMQLPRNVTGRAYRGVNVPMLWGAAQAFGYEPPFWRGEDQGAALAEGWGIFDNSHHGQRIERYDAAKRFDSDAAAVYEHECPKRLRGRIEHRLTG